MSLTRMSMFALRAAPRARVMSVVEQRTMSTLGDSFGKKEKVEEELYIRKKEKEALDKLREKLLQEQKELLEQYEKDVHEQVVSPTMNEIAILLEKTGDKVSPEGLEALAKWHQNHPAPKLIIGVDQKDED